LAKPVVFDLRPRQRPTGSGGGGIFYAVVKALHRSIYTWPLAQEINRGRAAGYAAEEQQEQKQREKEQEQEEQYQQGEEQKQKQVGPHPPTKSMEVCIYSYCI
jgi:hypothetical protein